MLLRGAGLARAESGAGDCCGEMDAEALAGAAARGPNIFMPMMPHVRPQRNRPALVKRRFQGETSGAALEEGLLERASSSSVWFMGDDPARGELGAVCAAIDG